MKRSEVVLSLFLILAACSRVAAQDGFEFTLDEVDAAGKPGAGKAAAGKAAAGKPAVSKPAAVDSKVAIADALGEVRWGMSKADLLKVFKARIRVEFEQRIKVERDIMRQDALYQAAKDEYRRISENFIEFDVGKSGWDVSPIGSEFTRGNREAMLIVTNKTSRELYFFIQGKLWKWYRELSPEAVNAGDPDEALSVLKQRFGPGKPQKERQNDSQDAYPGSTWSDGSTRVTAMLRGSDTCLILEDVHTIEQLSVLRHHVDPKAPKNRVASTIDAILLSGPELEARTH
jgi:hypothetical protein